MAEKIIEKLADLKYDEQITLAIVEKDEDLSKMFKDETKEKSFILLRQLVKENLLKPESKQFLRDIFDQVIRTKQPLIDQYLHLENNGTFEVKTAEIPTPEVVTIPKVVEPVVEKTAVIVAEKVKVEKKAKTKSDIELPKWYGKERITKEIAEQGGKATSLQNAMLKVNDLKNIYANISARGIKDMVRGSKLLSDEDCRRIVSVVTIAERQLAEILKKK